MSTNLVETVTGGVVILVSAVLLFYAYTSTQRNTESGYKIFAQFNKADGLVEGSDVKIGGIRVGSVSKLSIDPSTYAARVEMFIRANIKIPTDTSASIISESLLGGKYLDLQPGGDDSYLKEGGKINHTQSSVILESLIGQVIFGDKEKSKNTSESGASKKEAA